MQIEEKINLTRKFLEYILELKKKAKFMLKKNSRILRKIS